MLWGLLWRRRRGDKLANQQRYLLIRHKPVIQLLFGLRASKYGLRGFCRVAGMGDMHVHQRRYQLSRPKPVL